MASDLEREVTINMLLSERAACGKVQGCGGGTASITAAVQNKILCASRSAAAVIFT